jgi:hypothetical protein
MVAALLLLTLCASATRVLAAEETSSSGLTVRIVPTAKRHDVGAIDLTRLEDHFHVVLTNTSTKPIRIWREWCSWGYFGLSFEAQDRAGKTIRISKKQRGWDKNYPDWLELAPGEPAVIDVNLDPANWEASPLSGGSPWETRLRMKAVYEINRDEYSDKNMVWTGHAVSAELEYRLYWRPAENARRLNLGSKP